MLREHSFKTLTIPKGEGLETDKKMLKNANMEGEG